MKRSGLALLLFAAAIPVVADADNVANNNIPLDHFHVVSSGIYRGARPLEAGTDYLANELHVKTDLDLENDAGAIAAERGFVAAHRGMGFVSIPLGFGTPSDADVNRALAVLESAGDAPVYVHCKAGQDRTGLIIGLYRVLYQHEPPAQAYQEMIQDGFHASFRDLDQYFRKRTGWETADLTEVIPNPITNFHVVSPGIYRGARPLEAGIDYLATELRVKTDLDLENDDGAVAAEKAFVAARPGITMISIPLSGFWAPSDANANHALAILNDPANYPVFVHCEHGQDRTGLIVGLYRVLDQHVAPATAYQEMKDLGFHAILLGLDDYFHERTGWND